MNIKTTLNVSMVVLCLLLPRPVFSVAAAPQGGDSAVLQVRGGQKQVRPTFAAGTFYPADREALDETIKTLLTKDKPLGIRNTRAIVVPHAGYVYSGEVAAQSFREVGKDFRRVFLIASNHSGKVDLRGISIPAVTHYAIPGTEIPLSSVADEIMKQDFAGSIPEAHTMHMLEIELPFLYHLNGYPDQPGFSIIPIIVGIMDPQMIKRFATLLGDYQDDNTLFVFSIDLSHFYPEAKADELDRYAIESVMSRDAQAVLGAVTDGNQVLATLIEMAQINNWQPSFLMHRTSGYASSNKASVVGYTSIVFHDPLSLNDGEKKTLLDYARNVVSMAAAHGEAPALSPQVIAAYPLFNVQRASFVTLKKNGALRGCIGNLFPQGSLHEAVKSGAFNAALNDHRFKPVTTDELKDIKISISILDYPQRVVVSDPKEYLTLLEPLKDGVIIKYNGKSSTYLPQVWEDITQPNQFLGSLCEKQGSPAHCWQDKEARLFKYKASVFGEE
ncbi:MAG: AmmeMemoRadiSam system protein B [Deltaproteobacteria bacterium]|nr:AmmeMemoRadiSam system protein B [Deltaproteobacteria bacterium]